MEDATPTVQELKGTEDCESKELKETGYTVQELKGTCEYSKQVKDAGSKVHELEGTGN